ncbi:hypothetical protein ACFOMH_00310 [Paracoccus mangrovi]|uniref:Uncharacterized protein n=1 Tax=Paracoccus mangrovi TaxID=1715645 RepID=A0ABV7QZV9_9RHOB
MSLADHIGFFALGAARTRARGERGAAAGFWRQTQGLGARVLSPGETRRGQFADLGWHAAHQSLWGDDAEADAMTPAPEVEADLAAGDDLKFL